MHTLLDLYNHTVWRGFAIIGIVTVKCSEKKNKKK